METGILKSDIFFVVTTIFMSLIAVCSLVAFYYIIKILRDVREISQKVKEEGERIIEDVRTIREEAKSRSSLAVGLISKFFSVAKGRTRKKKELED